MTETSERFYESAGWERVGDQDPTGERTARLRVPGGFLYRVTRGDAVAVAFIPAQPEAK